MVWHPVAPVCPDCDKQTETTCVSFRADGQVAVEGYCKSCDHHMYIEFSAQGVFENCARMDNPNNPEFSLEHFHPKGPMN